MKLDLSPEKPTVIMVFEESVEVNVQILVEDGENLWRGEMPVFNFLLLILV